MLNYNSNPKLTKYLVNNKAFNLSPLTVVDVGARGGFEQEWGFYKDQVKLIGFEPDIEECGKLNQEVSDTKHQYFPFALHQNIEKRIFYVTQFSPGSTFYKPNMKFCNRINGGDNLNISKKIKLDTIDLDSFLKKHSFLGDIDFVKLDVEGTELDVLKGAVETLAKSVIGLSIEVRFENLQNQPFFSDIDSFVRSIGFSLFDLRLFRHSRRALPEPKRITWTPSNWGQVLWGQALYLRDAVKEIVDPDLSTVFHGEWNELQILKLASIMELYNIPDCSIELLQVANQWGLLNKYDVTELIDFVLPGLNAKEMAFLGINREESNHISYKEYMKRLANPVVNPVNIRRGKFYKLKKSLKKILPIKLRNYFRGILEKALYE